ncbi:MAG: bifunctional alpha,alpha-trehalose-phosphate synthase (UDP-forming)/trehalose-phosphatase [Parcubacteria group bacterium]|nr:bifunctional alpha,alpha-trehalose-phosphate synthase (UDP-forming)/trehalose-phosphatase [Parcubacteria group bacterium]
MGRVIIVTNRLPVTVQKRRGKYTFQPSIGGVATGLSSVCDKQNCLWIGWSGLSKQALDSSAKRSIQAKLAKQHNSYPVFLDKRDVNSHYYGFCNNTLWPLFHCFTQHANYSKQWWESYQRVNELYAKAVLAKVKPGDTIWIHDYHLMLLPKLIREKLPKANIGFFLHIPFPPLEIYRMLPWRKEILAGLLSADLVGFHTYDYVQNFLDSVHRLLGYEHHLGSIVSGENITKVDAFPMGIDYNRFAQATELPQVAQETDKIRQKVGECQLILSVDRLDYTKGILERLDAFSYFLDQNPQYIGKVTLILVAVPSRTRIENYSLLKKQLDEKISQINGKYSEVDWIPIWYLYRSLPFEKLVAFYRAADIALITPLRDGMNLIAKEYIATKKDGRGVLILSEMAGTANELREALIVNPNDKRQISKALRRALEMPVAEQKEHNRIIQKRLQSYDVTKWAKDFLDNLSDLKKAQQKSRTKDLDESAWTKLKKQYRRSQHRLILLDYDGTLVSFVDDPDKAQPDQKLLEIIKSLTDDKHNRVVVISGRDRHTMGEWLQETKAEMSAEHGVWVKEKGRWQKAVDLSSASWMKKIKPILEQYVDRTPGSFVEVKDYSLAWHYRKADPKLALIRRKELLENCAQVTNTLDLDILEGNKVIEIKSADINKGRIASRWLDKRRWDFILAIGDDRTDEDMFSVMPKSAYTIKVGAEHSQASWRVKSVAEARELLENIGV